MKKNLFLLFLILILCSHDMYLKLDNYFLDPNTDATIELFNGTFEKSENVIDRDRMLDASLVGNGQRYPIATNQWTEKDSITLLNFKTGDAGTWVAGVSTAVRSIEMAAADFNTYLEHDGVKDMLASREENGVLDQDAVEKYSKHVKTIFQVGEATSKDWEQPLGYPIEFIPLSNPYEKHTGDALTFKLLRDGKPLTNQLVYADHKASKHNHTHKNEKESHTHDGGEPHSHNDNGDTHDDHNDKIESHEHGGDEHTHNQEHSHDANAEKHSHDTPTEQADHDHNDSALEEHTHTTGQELRTNQNGEITIELSEDGIYYLRTIDLVTSDEEGLTHESNWATLTFEITHDHSGDKDHDHHDHENEDFPLWIFAVISVVVLAGLFLIFNRKKKDVG